MYTWRHWRQIYLNETTRWTKIKYLTKEVKGSKWWRQDLNLRQKPRPFNILIHCLSRLANNLK